MGLQEKLEKIDALKNKIDSFGALSDAIKKKINYKFRLDWNYYSNRMEGGTLTRQETRGVMVGNITVDGKPIKDVMEMNGHDQVVLEVLKMGQGEVRISESRIKDIHKAIISVVDNPEAKKLVGKWKETPNEILNYKGEKFGFVAPEEVPDAIHDLLNMTNAALDALKVNRKEAKHPLIIACDFHLGYVAIHPFFDGNGRTARILFNTILIACGFPPIIINDTEKDNYYRILGDIQAYGGNPDLFYGQMADLLKRSLNLVIDAAEGKEIEEKDDLDKRLELLKKMANQDDGKTIRLVHKDIDHAQFLYNVVFPVYKALFKKYVNLSPLFTLNQVPSDIDSTHLSPENYSDFEEKVLQWMMDMRSKKYYKISAQFNHKDFKKAGVNAFSLWWSFSIRLEETKYLIFTEKDMNQPILQKLYHQILTEEEIEFLAKEYFKYVLDYIDERLDHLNNSNEK